MMINLPGFDGGGADARVNHFTPSLTQRVDCSLNSLVPVSYPALANGLRSVSPSRPAHRSFRALSNRNLPLIRGPCSRPEYYPNPSIPRQSVHAKPAVHEPV